MRNRIFKISIVPLLMSAFVFLSSCSKEGPGDSSPPDTHISAILKSQSDLTLFVEALDKTDLLSYLQTSDELTLFAPVDAGFIAFLSLRNANNIDELISLYGKEHVRQTLQYNFIKGSVHSTNFLDNYVKTEAENSQGHQLDLYISHAQGNIIQLNGGLASIVNANFLASNGMIHKTNAVLTPPTVNTLLEASPDFSLLNETSDKAAGDFFDVLSDNDASYTLFAPNNAAFNTFFLESPGAGDVDDLVTLYGAFDLLAMLKYHSLAGIYRAEDIVTGTYNTRKDNYSIDISKDTSGNIVLTDGANRSVNVQFSNVTATNGVIHIITNVLLPD